MFSIIIPLYNKEASVAETLDTVLAQTFSEYEVVIVDDGSTDQSLSIVRTFTDERIKIYSKKNGGVSHARNYGIERAQYDYIAFLDADDAWDSNYLEEMSKLIKRHPECGMYNCAYRGIKGNRILIESPNIPDGVVQDYFKTTLTLENMISWTSATIVKKEVFAEVGMFPVGMISGEDSYMWCKVAMKHPVAYTHKIMATYNMMMSGAYSRIAKPDSCKESWSDLYRENEPYLNKFIAYKAVENGLRHAWAGQKLKSRLIEHQLFFAKRFNDRYFNKRFVRLFLLNRVPHFAVRVLLLYKKLVTIRFFGPRHLST